MELYHGSYANIEKPRVQKGQYTKDFGTGFYCTIMKQQAERWAGRFDTPYVNVYEYTLKDGLQILEFKEMTDEWLEIAFCTEAALECLTYKSSYSL